MKLRLAKKLIRRADNEQSVRPDRLACALRRYSKTGHGQLVVDTWTPMAGRSQNPGMFGIE